MLKSCNRNTSLKKVLNGNFPEKVVKKMNRKHLESFVLKLVECSSEEGAKNAKSFSGLYKSFCLKQINKPEWWPSEKIIEQSLTSDGKYVMELLRFLVYKCCEFFKKPCEGLNEKIFVNDNDENCRGVKRKHSIINVPSKRRTLMPRNSARNHDASKSNALSAVDNTIIKTPIIRLKDICYNSKPEPLKQEGFLKIFDLQSTFTHTVEEQQMPSISSSSIKFNSCSVIPFSSDLGRELMKRENHCFPESLQNRRLERLEWYVNQPPPRYTNMFYEVTYQEKKDLTFHKFKFPRRNIWQQPGDVEYQKKVLFCKPLKVLLLRNNFEAIENKICSNSKRDLKIIISRLSVKSTKSPVRRKKHDKRRGLKNQGNQEK